MDRDEKEEGETMEKTWQGFWWANKFCWLVICVLFLLCLFFGLCWRDNKNASNCKPWVTQCLKLVTQYYLQKSEILVLTLLFDEASECKHMTSIFFFLLNSYLGTGQSWHKEDFRQRSLLKILRLIITITPFKCLSCSSSVKAIDRNAWLL